MKLDTALILAAWLALAILVGFAVWRRHQPVSLSETQDTLYARCEALIATRDSIAMLEIEKRIRWASWIEAADLAARNRR